MKVVIENYSGKKLFYRSQGNLWEILVKTAICNTFTKINLDFKQGAIALKFPEQLFPGTYFNDCFCPYRIKFVVYQLILHLCNFLPQKTLVIMFSILHIFFVFFIIYNPVYNDCYSFFNKSASFKEKLLPFTKCFSYFVLKTAFTFWENKKFGKLRFCSSYSFTVFVRSFYISDDG